jgi:BON domain-containing protein
MAYRSRSDFGRGERDEEFRGNRGSHQEFGRDYEESGRPGYSQQQRGFGQPSYGQGQQNFGQHGGYSEEGGYDRERRQGFPGPASEGYRRYGESYGRGPEGMDRETGSYSGYGSGSPQGVGGSWQQSGGTRGYGSEFGRGVQDFGGGSSFGETQRPESATRGRFTGRGPKGYTRSDERIQEDVSDRLEQHGEIDATDIEVRVSNGEVTLEGTVEDRRTKRLAEDIIETCPGVKQVHNRIRVQGNGGEREKGSDKSSTSRSSMKS